MRIFQEISKILKNNPILGLFKSTSDSIDDNGAGHHYKKGISKAKMNFLTL